MSSGVRRRRPNRHASVSTNGKHESFSSPDDYSSSPQQYSFVRSTDAIVLGLLTLLAVLTRFYRLEEPAAVVFDELHFQKFVDRHLAKSFYFDIHPPLGKLILAYGGYLLGYRSYPSFVIEKIGDIYPATVNFYALRCVSALFSAATVPMAYLVARALRLSRAASVLCGFLVLTDLLGTIEGRLIIMESQLLFFLQLALLCALRLWQTRPRSKQRWITLFMTGCASGLALSIKHTALATPALIAIVSFFGTNFLSEPMSLLECLVAGVVGFATYAIPFYPVLTREWISGGPKYDNFMSAEFRSTLINSSEFDPSAIRPGFWRMFLFLNKRMLSSNASVSQRHVWESYWYQWIINWRGVLYYTSHLPDGEDGTKGGRAIVYLIGNPLGIVFCLTCVVAFVVVGAIHIRTQALSKNAGRPSVVPLEKLYTGLFLFAGWVCNLAPYALVDRSSFLYHYIPGLFYAQLLSASVTDMLPPRLRYVVVCIFSLGTVMAFIYWSPWVYAMPLSDEQHLARRWLSKWT